VSVLFASLPSPHPFLCLVSDLKRAQVSTFSPCLPGFTLENRHRLRWLLAESRGCQPAERGSGRAVGLAPGLEIQAGTPAELCRLHSCKVE